jgi:hypothetical protein
MVTTHKNIAKSGFAQQNADSDVVGAKFGVPMGVHSIVVLLFQNWRKQKNCLLSGQDFFVVEPEYALKCFSSELLSQ